MNLDLKGRRALVCGSTQGIGRAAAIELALLGASITLIARNEDRLKETIGMLDASAGQKHSYLTADFSAPELLKEKVENYLKSGETVHILVNNTGGPPGGKISAARGDEFRSAFESHLIANHYLMLSVIEGMKKAGFGRIINIISTSVKIPLKGLGVSNTIRAAVANWAKTLSNEVGSYGITVNNVLPGATNTARLKSIIEAKSEKSGESAHEIASEMEKEIPVGRFAEAEEIGAAVAFLASPAAAYINGINLPVDGGRTGSL